MKSCFDITATVLECINSIQKIMLEFITQMTETQCNLVKSLSPCGQSEFEKLFSNGLMKLRIRFLIILMISDFQMSMTSLFHSLIVAGKQLFWKKLCLVPNKEMLSDPRVGRDAYFLGIALKRKEGDWLTTTLYKKDSFLYHRLF